jgi:TM2 domain-containing membrane protein YozV/predicted Ser/Thr protein kinase
MSYCLNPTCQQPQNSDWATVCTCCGSKLRLGDRYRAIRLIGTGGFGRTFLGVDEYKPSKPRCVIKQFRVSDVESRSANKAIELFWQEALRLEELGKHPQIPDLFAHFEQEGRQYLIQEYIDGQNLAQELDENGIFSEVQIRHLLEELLPALQFIHQAGIIHRDIKPENIIRQRSDNHFVLVDFGAAKSAHLQGRTGTVIGSAGYAAPEQTFGKAVYASDLYSLGVTCIHLLTQVPPFDLFDTREGQWVWRDYLVDNPVSPQLGRVLDTMLESALSQRYSSAAEVLADLQPPSVWKQESRVSRDTPAHAPSKYRDEETTKRIKLTYLMWAIGFFFGVGLRPLRGLHRFYNGKIVTGLLWMIPGIGDVGILLDLFLIPGIVDEYQDRLRERAGLSSAGVPLTEPAGVERMMPVSERGQLIVKLLKAAQARGGKLSVTQAVMDTGLDFMEVETVLQQMATAGYVSIAHDKGIVTYCFDEISRK